MKTNQKDLQWQLGIYKKARNLAGKRYTPELNIDLPIDQTFDGLARNKYFYTRIRKLFGELRKSKNDIFPRNNAELLGIELINFDYCFEKLLSLISQINEYSNSKLPWEEIKILSKKLDKYAWDLQDKMRQVQKSSDNEKKDQYSDKIFSSESYYITRLVSSLYDLNTLCNSDSAKLSNHRFLLLTGVTGIGKTHLLCDVVKKRMSENAYSFITLGQEINKTDSIWKQIIKLNKDNRVKSKNALLTKFDNLGKKAKSRFFIIIDALNESQDPSYWKSALPDLLTELRHYPNVALIASVRSGFEKEVATTRLRKRFYDVEHVGFKFREWDAIKAFFTQFGLPLPEIPLLNPEFSVPLFLLLFCKSRQQRAKKKGNKELFRGHEGSTSIFEDFIKGVSKSIGKEFGIGSVDDVWNKLIKPLAKGMVSNRGHKDKISESQFKKLLARELPLVDFTKLTLSLERSHLLIRIPRYGKNGNKVGFDYRFTYQRFSDHLIARYLLNRYADTKTLGTNATVNLRKKLRKSGTLGKQFYDYSFRGVISALSIQVPERLGGEELINLCPWAKQILEKPFLESIIWRNPKAFYLNSKKRPEKTISIINTLVLISNDGASSFFSTVLNVSGVPNHPFNALRLHYYLMTLGRVSRDQIWSTFLHYHYGGNDSIDRLLYWVLSSSFNKAISSQSKILMGIVLTWFLSTPNRSVRDKATKGLITLLENSPQELFELHKLFIKVDDLYISERLYAITYGVILRLDDYKNPILKDLGELIYKNVFLSKKPVAHILVRDYAKCTIDVLAKEKVYSPSKPSKAKAILNTEWPSRLPTMKTLEDKFEPKGFSWDNAPYEARGVRAIWNSFDGIADFFRYIVEPAVNHWADVKKDEPMPPSKKELEEEFVKSLSREQKKIYKQIGMFHRFSFIRITRYLKIDKENTTPEEKKKIKEENRLERLWKAAKKSFWDSLLEEQKKAYRAILRRTQYRYPRKTGQFNSELAKRWILKRVFELYSTQHHGYFDGMIASHHNVSREDYPAERIGKKYQWIALHELLGYLADNFRFLAKDYPPEGGEYRGAWQIGVRDIDPTCISLKKPGCDDPLWQPKYDAWRAKETSEKWIKRKADLPNPELLVEYKDRGGSEWYILNSFFEWKQDIPPEEERYEYPSRDIFYIWYSYLIKEDEAGRLFNWFLRQNFYGRWMPEVRAGIQESYLREYPDSEIYKAIYSQYDTPPDGWITKIWGCAGRKKMPGSIMEVYNEYSVTNASRDKSVEESFNIALPSEWLIKGMNLKHSDQDGFWINKKGETVCGDLSLIEGGKSVLAIRKKDFLKFLKKNKLFLVWTLVGEKALLSRGNGKIQQISGSYLLKFDGSVSGRFKMISEKDTR